MNEHLKMNGFADNLNLRPDSRSVNQNYMSGQKNKNFDS